MLYRQGDVLIMRVTALPDHAQPVNRRNGRVVLAEGEATGHAHAIADPGVDLYETAQSVDRWLRISQAGATLRHEEHSAIALPPGDYLVRIQREYDPMAARYVAD